MRVGEMPTRLAVKDTEQTARGGMNTDMAAQEDPTPKTQVFADIVRHLQMASTTGVDTHADITMGLRKNDVVQACHPRQHQTHPGQHLQPHLHLHLCQQQCRPCLTRRGVHLIRHQLRQCSLYMISKKPRLLCAA